MALALGIAGAIVILISLGTSEDWWGIALLAGTLCLLGAAFATARSIHSRGLSLLVAIPVALLGVLLIAYGFIGSFEDPLSAIVVVVIGAGFLVVAFLMEAAAMIARTRHPYIYAAIALSALGSIIAAQRFATDQERTPKNYPAVYGVAIDRGVLYAGTSAGLLAIDAVSGAEIWRFETRAWVSDAPAVLNGVVFFGTQGGDLYAVDVASHLERWSFHSGHRNFTRPYASPDHIVFGGYGGIYALDTATGIQQWAYGTPSETTWSLSTWNDKIVVADAGGHITALDIDTGAVAWQAVVGEWVHDPPAIAGDAIYFGNWDNQIYALNASDGEVLWNFGTGAACYPSPVVVGDLVYAGSNDHTLYALDAATGAERWRFAANSVVYEPVAILGETLFFASGGLMEFGTMYALEAATGVQLWSYSPGEFTLTAPIVHEGVVYAGSDRGNLFAIDAATGTEIWRFQPVAVAA